MWVITVTDSLRELPEPTPRKQPPPSLICSGLFQQAPVKSLWFDGLCPCPLHPQTLCPVGKADSHGLFRHYWGGHLKWLGCGGQARGIFLEEGLPELNLETSECLQKGGQGIAELAGTVGGSRSTGSQEILHRTER